MISADQKSPEKRRLFVQVNAVFDAFRRIVDAANILGCVWIVVDAKDEDSRRFYAKFDFVAVPGETWPRRMMIAIGTVRAVLADS